MSAVSHIDMSAYSGITQDSRAVEPGFLFVALPGVKLDGRYFIPDALAKGASGILTVAGTEKPAGLDENVAWITADNPRQALSQAAAAFYKDQPETIVAVTGTNGKTSVAHFTQQLWAALGHKAASLGTLGLQANMNIADIANAVKSLTTPDPVALHRILRDITGRGVSHLAFEASSHGLDQHRLDGVKIGAAAFTNFTRDHLDYHKTEEAYLQAKLRLFTDLLPRGGIAVLNADIPQFEHIRSVCMERDQHIVTYGFAGEDYKIVSVNPNPTGLDIKLQYRGAKCDIALPLIGGFQAHNALVALGLVLAEKPGDQDYAQKAIAALSTLKGAPGRVEAVFGHPTGAAVYIDYAHTPDALETVLKAVRPHVQGRLICLFGCGGDRDAGKRAPMGDAVHTYADIGILTDDNPRREDPAMIRAEAKKGAPDAIEIAGRAEAIAYGVQMLERGDVFVIAGKGHEQGQEIKGEIHPFCDKTMAEKSIKELERN